MREVVVILPNLARGGAERLLVGLANHVPKDRFNAKIIALSNEGGEGYSSEVPVQVFPGKYIVNMLFSLPPILRRLKSDDVVNYISILS